MPKNIGKRDRLDELIMAVKESLRRHGTYSTT